MNVQLPTPWRSPIGATVKRRIRLPSLNLQASERRLLLLIVDILLINVALLASVWLAWEHVTTLKTLLLPYKWYITLTLVWALAALFFDLYNLARSASTFAIVRSASIAISVTVLVYSLIPSLTPSIERRSQIFIFAGLALGLVVGWRVLYSQLFVQPFFHQRALVVGAGWAGSTLAEAMQTHSDDANPYRGTGYDLVGFIDDNPAYAGATVQGVPVLGAQESLVPLAQALQINEIIVAITHRHAINDALFDALLHCREAGIRISTMSDLYERLLGRVPVQHVGRDLYIALPSGDASYQRLYLTFRRLLDVLVALLGLAVLAVVSPLVALANHVTSPGPLIYSQQRVGRGGKPFLIYKFRSMIPDAEAGSGAVWASTEDDRITRVGRVLRRTRLDELPQFINVLRGEMSLIGPRPERPEFVEQLAQTIPFYRARHAMRPGLTGWAQVQYRYGSSVDDSRIKLEYDLYYVKHASFLLDLRILLQTVQVMLSLEGR